MYRDAVAIVLLAFVGAVLGGVRATAQDGKIVATSLFNGTDLTGWSVRDGEKSAWSVKGGVLVCTGKGGWLMSETEYANGSFFVEYRITKGANSGLAIRTPLKGDPAYQGLEIQILDDDSYKDERADRLTGAIWDVMAPRQKAAQTIGTWNNMTVIFEGPLVAVSVNGKTILNANRKKLSESKELVKKHPGLLREKGRLGLQGHTGLIEFRKVVVVTKGP